MAGKGNGNGGDDNPLMSIGGASIWHVLVCLLTPDPGNDSDVLAPLWWGPGGFGKTTQLNRAARAVRERLGLAPEQFLLETMIASTCDPTDFRGLPVLGTDGTRFLPPEEAVRLAKAGRGWLFLDEVSDAVPAVQAALKRFVHKRCVGLLQLPPGIKIVAAGNPPEAGGGYDQSAVFGNRWTHLSTSHEDLTAGTDEWIEWLLHRRSAADNVPIIDEDRWQAEYETSKAIVAAFIRANPTALAEKEADCIGRFPLAYATRRTWDSLSCLQASCRALGRNEELEVFARGSIGPAYGMQYVRYDQDLDLPDPEVLLANPSLAKPDLRRPDRDYAIVQAVCSAATRNLGKHGKTDKRVLDRYVNAWIVLENLMEAGEELVAIGANDYLVDKHPAGALLHPVVRRVTRKLSPVLKKSAVFDSAET